VGIILHSDLNWADHVNYIVKKVWKALYFIMCILKRGNSSTKSLAYTTLVCLILEYEGAYLDPYREGQTHVRQGTKKAAKFAHHTNKSNWETLSRHRKISRICALFKAYSGEQVWKATGDRLKQPIYLS
jgi:uncharacterized protein YfeS